MIATCTCDVYQVRYTYASVGRLTGANERDASADFLSSSTFAYDDSARSSVTDNAGSNDTPHLVLTSSLDGHGQRTSLAATVDNVVDFTNAYQYDLLERMTRVEQFGTLGGNAVAEKRIDFEYNAASQFATIKRYSDLDGGPLNLVATTNFGFDSLGRLTSLAHAGHSQFSYTHDTLDRIKTFAGPDGTSTYTYDPVGQVVSAVHSGAGNSKPSESYSFDANGNRTNTGYSTGTDNRLLQSVVNGQTFQYQYDPEGNLTRKTNISTGDITEYTWDYRNRLASVARRSASGTLLLNVSYTYDAFDRRIAKAVDPDGAGPEDSWRETYIYDGDHIALVYLDPDASGPQPSTLRSRLLHGPTIDMILADESFAVGGTGTAGLFWLLTDHLSSVRDVLNSQSCAGTGHIDYTAFGQVARVTHEGQAASVSDLGSSRFLYTGREFDAETGLQYNRARYFDAAIAQFLSEDPLGFHGGDANLRRYVWNNPVAFSDPEGTEGKRNCYIDLLVECAREQRPPVSSGDPNVQPFVPPVRSQDLPPSQPLPVIDPSSVPPLEIMPPPEGITVEALIACLDPVGFVCQTAIQTLRENGHKEAARLLEILTYDPASDPRNYTPDGEYIGPQYGVMPSIGSPGKPGSLKGPKTGKKPIAPKGKYSNLPDPKNVGEAKDFTPTTKRNILEQNKQANGGVIRSDQSGVAAVPSQKSRAGVTPPTNEAQIDHIEAKSKRGTNSPSNAQVLTREENRIKSDK